MKMYDMFAVHKVGEMLNIYFSILDPHSLSIFHGYIGFKRAWALRNIAHSAPLESTTQELQLNLYNIRARGAQEGGHYRNICRDRDKKGGKGVFLYYTLQGFGSMRILGQNQEKVYL